MEPIDNRGRAPELPAMTWDRRRAIASLNGLLESTRPPRRYPRRVTPPTWIYLVVLGSVATIIVQLALGWLFSTGAR